MADLGHQMTDKELEELEKKIHKTYKEAYKEMQDKVDAYFDKLKDRDKEQQALLETGKITKKQYEEWRLTQYARGERYRKLRDEFARRMNEANKVAAAYVNDTTPGIYSLNANYMAYTIEQSGAGVDFNLIQEQAVRRLIVEEPELFHRPAIDTPLDVVWNQKKLTDSLTAGILMGESTRQIADRFQKVTDMNRTSALRNARTAVTGAQNAGRQATYDRAREMGLKLDERWLSTKDYRTRDSHRVMDGKPKDKDGYYHTPLGSIMRYPGDMQNGKAADVYNCRCTTTTKDPLEAEPTMMRARDPVTGRNEVVLAMTYQEWYEWKESDDKDAFIAELLNKNRKAAEEESTVKEIRNALDFGYGNFTKDDYNKWWDDYEAHNSGVHLSKDELKIIEDYTEGSYIALNDVCRYSDSELLKKGYSAEDIARIRKKADMLDGALSKYDLDTDIVTHRFERDVSWLTGNGNGIEDLENLVGKEYTAKGFTSSGMLPNRFRFTGGKKDAVHFEIVTPKGTNGAFLSMSQKGENEFLYNRNTRFKILDGGERVVKEMKLNIKTMQMEEIDVVERFLKVQVILDDVVDEIAEEMVEKSVKKAVFTAAKTREEAEGFVRQFVDDKQFGALGVSYEGISVDSANMVNAALSGLYETFNIDKLGGVYVAKGNTKLGKTIEGATAAYSPIRKTLILNNRAMKNVDDIAKSHAEELNLIKSYKKDPASLAFKTKRAENVMKASMESGRCTVPETITEVIYHEMGHSMEKTLQKMPSYDTVKANMPTFAEKVSGYSTFNEGEYIAESFASYMKGENVIDPELRKLFEALKR